jgi:pentatricopeptide repeat protein
MQAGTPLLAVLRRLEAQHVWRVASSMAPRQTMSTAVEEDSADWSTDPATLTGNNEALKQLIYTIQNNAPTRQRNLPAMYNLCQSPEDIDKAREVTRFTYLARGKLETHQPYPPSISQSFVHSAVRTNAIQAATEVLKNPAAHGFGGVPRERDFHPLLIHHSRQGNLLEMLEVYEFMKSRFAESNQAIREQQQQQGTTTMEEPVRFMYKKGDRVYTRTQGAPPNPNTGIKPGPDTCHVLVKGCVDCGRPDLAEMIIKEFEESGARVRNGTRLYLDQNRKDN